MVEVVPLAPPEVVVLEVLDVFEVDDESPLVPVELVVLDVVALPDVLDVEPLVELVPPPPDVALVDPLVFVVRGTPLGPTSPLHA